MSTKHSKGRTLAVAIAIFVAANVAHILFWYFVVLYAPPVLGAVAQISQPGKPTGRTVELVNLSAALTVVVMRWGFMPVFVGAIGDLTPYYVGFGLLVGAILGLWTRRRW